MLLVAIATLSSCGNKGDKEIEKQFVGKWVASLAEEEDDMEIYYTNEITYNEDNTFKQNSTIIFPEFGYDCSIFVTYEGEWYATKDKICEEIDENSIKMEFSDDYLDFSGMSANEAKAAFLAEMTSEDLKAESKIIKIGSDEIILSEDGVEYTLYRK